MPRLAPLALFVLAIATAGPARAGGAVEARFFDELGRREHQKGAYSAALDAFMMVNAIAPSAGSLYNVAVCAELAKKNDLAFTNYRQYLTTNDPDAERRADAERRLGLLQRTLALVEVTSEPPGASVYVDRQELGAYGVTPTVVVISPGEHTLRLSLEGHEPEQIKAVGVAGETARASVALRAELGELTVVTTPVAPVEILGKTGRVTANSEKGVYRLPVGSYVVRIKPSGHAPAEARVVVRAGESARVALVAPALPVPAGKILVSTGRVPAEVFVDGERTAMTPAVLHAVPVGEHLVELRARGHQPSRTKLTVKQGETRTLEIELMPVAKEPP